MLSQITLCLIPQASVCSSFKVCTEYFSNLLSVSGSETCESRGCNLRFNLMMHHTWIRYFDSSSEILSVASSFSCAENVGLNGPDVSSPIILSHNNPVITRDYSPEVHMCTGTDKIWSFNEVAWGCKSWWKRILDLDEPTHTLVPC